MITRSILIVSTGAIEGTLMVDAGVDFFFPKRFIGENFYEREIKIQLSLIYCTDFFIDEASLMLGRHEKRLN